MIEIDGKIVSIELFKENFMCDLEACKGMCCVEGAAGAPVTDEEIETLKEKYEIYKPYMKPEGIETIKEEGFSVLDYESEETTPLINGRECAYSYEEDGVTLCAIEKAWFEGEIEFRKPISCHLYPIRVLRYRNGGKGLNYQRWSVCDPAVECGNRLKKPVFRALKEPIVRAWGEDFYDEMEDIYKNLTEEGLI